MFKSYLTTALRNISRHKIFSAINIFGLAIGIAACLLIQQYVRYEKGYDNFYPLKDRIFRVQQDRYEDGKLSTQWAAGSAGIGPLMKTELPEVEDFGKLTRTGGVMSYGENKFMQENMYYANEAFLNIFSYKAIKGSIKGSLSEVNTAVITESIAKKYFGNEDPIGKVISRNKKQDYKITAVVKDAPANAHLKFTILFSLITFIKNTSQDADIGWYWDGYFTYLLLRPGADIAAVEKKMNLLAHKQYDPEGIKKQKIIELKLQPLETIHLNSNYMGEAEPNGDGKAVQFLLYISVFIIIIAWINYINLSTARSIERAKEVGVRKVMGSHRGQLIRQFLFESLVINFLAVVVAFVLVILSLPLFNSLTGKDLSFSLITDSNFWYALTAIFIGGAFLSGFYPAFVLSSFRPIEVLKGKLVSTHRGSWLRQFLVVTQFAASVALMVATYGIFRQLNFMKSQNLGVNIDQTLVIRGPGVTDSTYLEKLSSFKREMLAYPSVKRVAASSAIPGDKVPWNAGGIKLVGSDPNKANQYRVFGVDYDFMDAYGLKVLKGRTFSEKFGSDSAAVVFNESAVHLLGFHKLEDALNKQIEFWGNTYTIVGVVANHHQESLRQNYDSYIFRFIPQSDDYFSVKLTQDAGSVSDMVKIAENKWKSFFPGNPFDYFFLDDHYDKQYRADEQFGKTFALFAVLAIIVACLGLFGLASFVTTQRTKEIGIRKISGAEVSSIVILLTRDFIKPVLLAIAIASPLTFYLFNNWLENFAFKSTVSAWMFILPAIVILLIAILTVSLQTIKAASANPVKSLRTE